MDFHGEGKSTTDQGLTGHGGDEGGGIDKSEGRGGVQGSKAQG